MSEDSNTRNSMGKTSTSSSSKKILPHYLRASTGSCHDIYKYGREHALQAKGKHRILRSFATTVAEGEDSDSVIEYSNKNSMGKISTSSSGEKIPPRYLRASTGSCHDICKYGRKHALQAKGKRRILRSFATTVAEGEDSVNGIVSERKKKPSIKLRSSLDSKTQSPNNYEIIRASTGSCHDFCKYGRKHALQAKGKHRILRSFATTVAAGEDSVNGIVSERKKKPSIKLRSSLDSKTQSPNNYEIIRASTGSCHDFCKYGRKHALQAKGKRRILRSFATTVAEGEDSVNGIVSESKKKISIKLRSSLDSKTQSPNNYEIIRASTGSCHDFCKYGRKHALQAKGKRRILRSFATTVAEGEDSVNGIVSERKKKTSIKLRSSLDSKTQSPNNYEIINQEDPSSGKKKKAFPKQALSPAKKIEVSPKHSLSPAKKLEASTKQTIQDVQGKKDGQVLFNNEVKKSEPKLSNPLEENTLYAIKQPENKNFGPVQNESHMSQSSPYSSSSSLSLNSSSSQSSLLLSSSHVEEENEGSESMISEAYDSMSECDPAENENQVETLNVEDEESGTDCPPQKLKFRRGQVVNLQSENNGPRRLRFRQGRVLGEKDGKGDIGRKSFRRREVTDGDTDGTKPESEEVVLRHQDVQGKKDVQGLVNSEVKKAEPKLSNPLKENSLYAIEQPESKSLEPAQNDGDTDGTKPESEEVVLRHQDLQEKKDAQGLVNSEVKKAEPKLSNPFKENTLYAIEQPESESLEPAQNGSHTTQSSPSLSSSSSSLSSLLSLNFSSSQSSPLLSSNEEEENEESEYMIIEAGDSISEYDKTENENQVKTSNMEDKKSGRGPVYPENTDCSPRKLKFRRGQVVNLRSENNGPRRLRFRRGRVLGENDGKGDIGRKSFRRREVTDGPKPESEKVVLRHQDVLGKKNDQGLFNNVIEETAGKLVETRKSKVKALVGAFETVISLQDS